MVHKSISIWTVSAALIQKRQQFDRVLKRLRELEMKHSMIFPSMLRVVHGGKTKVFRSPNEVEAFAGEFSIDSP